MKTFKQFQEGVAALKVGSKLLPKLMIGVGAGGTLFKAQEYIKRNLDQKKRRTELGNFGMMCPIVVKIRQKLHQHNQKWVMI